jgi:hypothetical protein
MVEQFARGTQQAALSPATQDAPAHQMSPMLLVSPLLSASHKFFMFVLEHFSRRAQQASISFE